MSAKKPKTLADVQKCLDKTSKVLTQHLETSRMSQKTRIQLARSIAELEQCKRDLPELVRRQGSFQPVFDLIARIVFCWLPKN